MAAWKALTTTIEQSTTDTRHDLQSSARALRYAAGDAPAQVMGIPTTSALAVNSGEAKKPALSKQAKALAALVDHPDWSDEEIADAAGCHPKSLYRMQKFVDARALQKAMGTPPPGKKDGETGDVEAWDNNE